MGLQTTVIIRNDGLGDIRNNAQEFVDNLYEAINRIGDRINPEGIGIDIAAGCHANPARVVEVHHSDATVAIAAGGGTARILARLYRRNWPSQKSMLDDFIKALRNERDAEE